MKIKFFFLFLLASVSSVVYALPVSPEEPPNPLDLLPALGSVVEGATGEALAPSVPGGDLPDPQTSVEQQPTEHQPAEEPTMQQAEIDLTPEDEDWANREALRQAQLRNQFQRPPRSENDADLFKILEGFFKPDNKVKNWIKYQGMARMQIAGVARRRIVVAPIIQEPPTVAALRALANRLGVPPRSY